MDIVKCNNCSRAIHIYAEDHGKCPFCNARIASDNKPDNSFGELPAFLSEKLAKIDEHIEGKRSKEVLLLIDEILEWIPGWKIGEKIPQTGEIYWRKLLAEAECKSDFELLRDSKKSLHNFTAFNNAKKYATANEGPVYTIIGQAEKLKKEYLEKALTEGEADEKRKTGIGDKLSEYKQRMTHLEKNARKYLSDLEKVEKSLCGQAIDCEIVFTEHLHAIGVLLTEAKKTRDTCDARILRGETANSEEQAVKAQELANNDKAVFGVSEDEKKKWEARLDKIIVESNAELNSLKELASSQPETSHWRFSEYLFSLNDQKSIITKINSNKNELRTLHSKAKELVATIAKISNDYNEAREAVAAGNYEPAGRLLDRVVFNDIVSQAMSDAKLDSL